MGSTSVDSQTVTVDGLDRQLRRDDSSGGNYYLFSASAVGMDETTITRTIIVDNYHCYRNVMANSTVALGVYGSSDNGSRLTHERRRRLGKWGGRPASLLRQGVGTDPADQRLSGMMRGCQSDIAAMRTEGLQGMGSA